MPKCSRLAFLTPVTQVTPIINIEDNQPDTRFNDGGVAAGVFLVRLNEHDFGLSIPLRSEWFFIRLETGLTISNGLWSPREHFYSLIRPQTIYAFDFDPERAYQ